MSDKAIIAWLEELCELESTRQTRLLSRAENSRWRELQRLLIPQLCDFTTGSGEERRETLRVPCPLEVTVASLEATFKGVAIDVSHGGIGVKANILPALGERVVVVAAEQFVLGITGHVVWQRKVNHPMGAGFGIAFDPENETQEQHLATLLLHLLRKEVSRRK